MYRKNKTNQNQNKNNKTSTCSPWAPRGVREALAPGATFRGAHNRAKCKKKYWITHLSHP